jgi:hypothetical protein
MKKLPLALGWLAAVAAPTMALAQEDGEPRLEPAAPSATATPPATATPIASTTPGASASPAATASATSSGLSDVFGERPARAEAYVLAKRFEMGARFGYGRALGGGASNVFQVAAYLPILVEAGYRASPRISLLFGLQYAPLFRNGCIDGRDCGGRAFKGMGTLVYHFKPGAPFEPWFGYGMGYESIQLNGPIQYEVRNAFEIMNLQFGGDWLVSEATSTTPLRLGPYLGMSVDMPLSSTSRQSSAHGWMTLGVRGTLDL